MSERVVIVGGGLAGVRAVEALRAGGFEGAITLVSGEAEVATDRPPLSKQILRGEWEPARASLRSADELDALGVEVRARTHAVGLDLAGARVALDTGEQLAYDGLVIATGARARQLPELEGRAHVHTIRTLADARGLHEAARSARRVVVLGAGFLGAEVASSLRLLGLEVSVIETAQVPMGRGLGAEVGGRYGELIRAAGVELRLGVRVASVSTGGRGTRLQLDDGGVLEADEIVVAVGAAPNLEWLADSGLELADGVLADAFCAAAPRVYVAGDIASWEHNRAGRRVRLEHWTNAADQGAAAATNLAAELRGAHDERTQYAPIPYVWSDQFGHRIQIVGLPGAGDAVRFVEHAPEAGALVALFEHDGSATGLVGVDRVRVVARATPLLTGTTPVGEVLELIESVLAARR